MAKSAKPISLERSVEKEYITHIHMSLNFFTLYTYSLLFPDIKILTGILRMRIFKTRPLKCVRFGFYKLGTGDLYILARG